MSTPFKVKDCKCGAKYIYGLPSEFNGQIIINYQIGKPELVCTKCHNEKIAKGWCYDGFQYVKHCAFCGGHDGKMEEYDINDRERLFAHKKCMTEKISLSISSSIPAGGGVPATSPARKTVNI